MNREAIIEILRDNFPSIADRYRVRSLSLFGSASRGELRPDSDVDLLVCFDGPATLRGYCGLQRHLEGLLERRVDLITEKALRPELRPHVEKDLIRVT